MFNDLFDESGLGGSAAERQAIAQRWHQLNASVAISLASNIAAEMEPTISITTVTGDGKGPKAKCRISAQEQSGPIGQTANGAGRCSPAAPVR